MGVQRKYTDIHVYADINVSSSGHYFTLVRYVVNGKRVSRDYCLTEGFLTQQGIWWKYAPAYLTRIVCNLLAQVMLSGEARYYEYDRDGNKRYKNLRYYDADHAKRLAEQLVKQK